MGCWPGFRRPFLVHTGGAPLFASRNAWNNSLTLRSAPHRCFVVSSANGGVSSRSLCRSWCRLRQTTKSCHGACSRGAERDRLASMSIRVPTSESPSAAPCVFSLVIEQYARAIHSSHFSYRILADTLRCAPTASGALDSAQDFEHRDETSVGIHPRSAQNPIQKSPRLDFASCH